MCCVNWYKLYKNETHIKFSTSFEIEFSNSFRINVTSTIDMERGKKKCSLGFISNLLQAIASSLQLKYLFQKEQHNFDWAIAKIPHLERIINPRLNLIIKVIISLLEAQKGFT